jgi:hypothetical protein
MNALLKTIDEVKREMRKIEIELEDDTLPHSDQALLQDGWEVLEEKLDRLENELWDAQRDAEQEVLDEGGERDHLWENRPPTPHPPELIRLGEGFYVTPEELDRMNNQVDDRANGPVEIGACGFACDGHCQTCEGGYDHSNEV